ncbi:MAG: MarR family transcriptional regulator [Gammaproteobacteria bacterium]|nr:MarR family transcriptional regulator [Gammaproteobacteria bacterium]
MSAKLTEIFPAVLYETAIVWRHKLDKRLKPLGLSQTKWRALLHLSLAKAPMTQTELAISVGIEGPTLTGLLDRLAKDGWIERHDVPHDRRSKTVHLTAKSQETLAQIYAIGNQLSSELLSIIPEADIKHCIDVIQKIKARAELLS